MYNEDFMESMSSKQVYSFISSHIKDLVFLKNSLNDSLMNLKALGDNMLALNLLFLLNTLVGLELQKFKSLMQKKDLIIDLLKTLLKMEFIMMKHVLLDILT